MKRSAQSIAWASVFLLGVCCAHVEPAARCGAHLQDRLAVVWGKSFDGEPLSDGELQTFSDTLDCLERCQ